jgi:hypothetical protein
VFHPWLNFHRFTSSGGFVSGEDHLVRAHRVLQARQRHFHSGVDGFEEGVELGLVGVIRDVAGIEHLHGEGAPGVFVRFQLHRMKFVVQQTAFAADEVGMEIIRLETIDDGGAFADAAALEFKDRDTRRRVFVGLEDWALGLGVVAGDFDDVGAHAHEERVEGVATGGEQRTAAGIFARVPAELAIPRSDAMIVVHFAVVNIAEQALIDEGAGCLELIGVTALEADAGFDTGFFDGGLNFLAIFP